MCVICCKIKDTNELYIHERSKIFNCHFQEQLGIFLILEQIKNELLDNFLILAVPIDITKCGIIFLTFHKLFTF